MKHTVKTKLDLLNEIKLLLNSGSGFQRAELALDSCSSVPFGNTICVQSQCSLWENLYHFSKSIHKNSEHLGTMQLILLQ